MATSARVSLAVPSDSLPGRRRVLSRGRLRLDRRQVVDRGLDVVQVGPDVVHVLLERCDAAVRVREPLFEPLDVETEFVRHVLDGVRLVGEVPGGGRRFEEGVGVVAPRQEGLEVGPDVVHVLLGRYESRF